LERPDAWPACLLGPYLERQLEELAPESRVSVAIEFAEQFARKSGSDAAIKKALGRPGQIWRRPDGKPLTTNGDEVSAAHCLGFTFAVAGPEGTACDAEAVVERPQAQWHDLLGEDRLKLAGRIARETSEATDIAATRLWTAMECLKKAGRPPEAPMVWHSKAPNGWVLLRSGKLMIVTCPLSLRGKQSPVVVAIAFEAGVENGAAAATLSQRAKVGENAAFDRPDAELDSGG
jgi:enediyne polyketide synthase